MFQLFILINILCAYIFVSKKLGLDLWSVEDLKDVDYHVLLLVPVIGVSVGYMAVYSPLVYLLLLLNAGVYYVKVLQ